ncbi:uncharacterized protein BJ171DRAFT_493281 [Polychytrium aggregatum]|uniref:uncharacterized protein n=1 Tax=Polychytrium aggregatum TaxID=110093 RepID=UPI0022FE2C29|nr:uncharacterized protein BJ171DRAFT_493281 [Polychytrium aggregatum]KAI9207633.1 hypothetical protein BJ171DRAFT_493281 [Polychytrium aggregatum]
MPSPFLTVACLPRAYRSAGAAAVPAIRTATQRKPTRCLQPNSEPSLRSIVQCRTIFGRRFTGPSKEFEQSKREWDELAMSPLVHKQTGIQIFLCGTHHDSVTSIDRVKSTIEQVRPAVVAVEATVATLTKFQARGQHLLPLVGSQGSPSGSTSQQLHAAIRPDEIQSLGEEGISPSLLKENSLGYGLEIAAAIESASCMGAIVKAIDMEPEVAANPTSPEDTHAVSSAKERFRIGMPRSISTRTTLLNRALFWIACRAAFGTKNIPKLVAGDVVRLSEFGAYLKIWAVFHPALHYYWIMLRDAIMLANLRRVMQALYNTEQSNPKIVVVVGKSHVFGMVEMWNEVLAKERFQKSPRSDRFAKILSSDTLPRNNQQWDPTEVSLKSASRGVQLVQSAGRRAALFSSVSKPSSAPDVSAVPEEPIVHATDSAVQPNQAVPSQAAEDTAQLPVHPTTPRTKPSGGFKYIA